MHSELAAVFLDTGEYFWTRVKTSFAFHINHAISKSRRSSRKEMIHAISSSSDMGCEKDHAEGEEVLVIKKIAKIRQIYQLLKE